ncbi:putative quinol monooxygenase [Gorillibacterium sp. CAU 1737]|uniref:putative quinol monooxygenase n=1 Tax=Gorillibacterium sp. CAU 1737 TaxID=3140362 RepID=UPI003260C214
MIIIHADIFVLPDKKADFLEAAKPLIAASQAEEGNLRYTLTEQTDQEDAFTMVEVWKDQQAVEAHNGSEHFQTFMRQAPAFASKPSQIHVFAGTEVKG